MIHARRMLTHDNELSFAGDPHPTHFSTGKLRLLLLDDDPIFCSIMKSLAKSYNVEMVCCQTFKSFKQSFIDHKPHIAILDNNLEEEMNGIEIAAQIEEKVKVYLVSEDGAWFTDDKSSSIDEFIQQSSRCEFMHKFQGGRNICINSTTV